MSSSAPISPSFIGKTNHKPISSRKQQGSYKCKLTPPTSSPENHKREEGISWGKAAAIIVGIVIAAGAGIAAVKSGKLPGMKTIMKPKKAGLKAAVSGGAALAIAKIMQSPVGGGIVECFWNKLCEQGKTELGNIATNAAKVTVKGIKAHIPFLNKLNKAAAAKAPATPKITEAVENGLIKFGKGLAKRLNPRNLFKRRTPAPVVTIP